MGRVGRAHGHDGSFYVEAPDHPLEPGAVLRVAGREVTVERRGGTRDRPLVRLSGIGDREAAIAARGERVLASTADAPLEEGEWLVEDLLGCHVDGLGQVQRVLAGPSCDVLEVGEEGVLVPLVADAVRRVDPLAGTIEVDLAFLGRGQPREEPEAPTDGAGARSAARTGGEGSTG